MRWTTGALTFCCVFSTACVELKPAPKPAPPDSGVAATPPPSTPEAEAPTAAKAKIQPPAKAEPAPAESPRLADPAPALIDQTKTYYDRNVGRRIYVQVDKPLYKPGETVWIKTWDLLARSLTGDHPSPWLRYELVSPKGSVVLKKRVQEVRGMANNDFEIPDSVQGGEYILRATAPDGMTGQRPIIVSTYEPPRLKKKLEFVKKAYGPGDEVTATIEVKRPTGEPLGNKPLKAVIWLDGETLTPVKLTTNPDGGGLVRFKLPSRIERGDGLLTVMVEDGGVTESISKSIPIPLNRIQLSLFPEGGQMITGLPARVYFEAKTMINKPADVDGQIVDDHGAKVASFSTYHDGLGRMEFTPSTGRSYHAEITRPSGISEQYPVPLSIESGCVLRSFDDFDGTEPALRVAVRCTSNKKIFVTALIRENVIDSAWVQVPANDAAIVFLKAKDDALARAEGVARVTAFDDQLNPVAERLLFRNRRGGLTVKVDSDQEAYGPREQVAVTLHTTNGAGQPVPAELALSVVDDTVLSYADDKNGHIMSKELLEPELNDKVEEPNFYFDLTEQKSALSMDLLMGTRGWRKFEWQKITAPQPSAIAGLGTIGTTGGGRLVPPKKPHAKGHGGGGGFVLDGALEGAGGLGDLGGAKGRGLAGGIAPQAGIGPQNNFRANGGMRARGALGAPGGGAPPADKRRAQPDAATRAATKPAPPAVAAPAAAAPPPAEEREARKEAPARDDDAKADKAEEKAPPRAPRHAMDEAPAAERVAPAAAPPPAAGPAPQAAQEPAAPPPAPKVAATPPANKAAGADLNNNGEGGLARNLGVLAPAKPPEQPPAEHQKAGKGKKAFGDAAWDNPPPAPPRPRRRPPPVFAPPPEPDTFAVVRVFPAPTYSAPDTATRTDFRETIFWAPSVKTGPDGKAIVTFYLSDAVTSFRISTEGAGQGLVGRAEKVLKSSLPFSMSVKLPVELTANDKVLVPLTVTNDRARAVQVNLGSSFGALLHQDEDKPLSKSAPGTPLQPNARESYFYPVTVVGKQGKAQVSFTAEAGGLKDEFIRTVDVVPLGFPQRIDRAGTLRPEGKAKDAHLVVDLDLANALEDSSTGTLKIFPHPVATLLGGVAGMLREPAGCFEQASSSNYPNVMVMQYLKAHDVADPSLIEKVNGLLEHGYQRLVGYETKEKGYEWFGQNPPHEALTAYGLLEFNDMKHVWGGVEDAMLDRTASWLRARRDGQGGYQRNGRALDSFGAASPEVTNAYITYSMVEAGYPDLGPELTVMSKLGTNTKDSYLLSLASSALLKNLNTRAEGKSAAARLASLQSPSGAWISSGHSITRSGGRNLEIETTALAAMALMRAGGHDDAVRRGIAWLNQNRSGFGAFGSTQATVLALRAMTEFDERNKTARQKGEVSLLVNDVLVKKLPYDTGLREVLDFGDYGAQLKPGANKIELVMSGKAALPFSLTAEYRSLQPANHPAAAVALDTKLEKTTLKMGENVRLTAHLTNKTENGLPMTLARIGLPSGLQFQTWQLKELKEKDKIAFWETRAREVIVYFRDLKANEVKEIPLDLVAVVPGEYTGPASSAYLYYTDDQKVWAPGLTATIAP